MELGIEHSMFNFQFFHFYTLLPPGGRIWFDAGKIEIH